MRVNRNWRAEYCAESAAGTNPGLRERVRNKYRMKNTTGYSLNAFLDFDTAVDIFQHVLIGSEGTLAFIAEAVLNTVPDLPVKYTGLLLYPGPRMPPRIRSSPCGRLALRRWRSWIAPRCVRLRIRPAYRPRFAPCPMARPACWWSFNRPTRANAPNSRNSLPTRWVACNCSSLRASRMSRPSRPCSGRYALACSPRSAQYARAAPPSSSKMSRSPSRPWPTPPTISPALPQT